MRLEQIGKELKSIRIKLGLTLEKASEITGIHKNTLCLYENNPSCLKLGRFLKILDSYGVDSSIFFTNTSEYIHYKNKQE